MNKTAKFDVYKTIQIVTLKIPAHLLTAAIDEVRKVKETWDTVDAERAALVSATLESVGRLGMEAREKELAALDARKEAATVKARAVIADLSAKYTADIDRQTTPSSADIAENPDFELLKNQLVETPAQLHRILGRNDNRAFRTAAARYGAGKGWDGFDHTAIVITVENR